MAFASVLHPCYSLLKRVSRPFVNTRHNISQTLLRRLSATNSASFSPSWRQKCKRDSDCSARRTFGAIYVAARLAGKILSRSSHASHSFVNYHVETRWKSSRFKRSTNPRRRESRMLLFPPSLLAFIQLTEFTYIQRRLINYTRRVGVSTFSSRFRVARNMLANRDAEARVFQYICASICQCRNPFSQFPRSFFILQSLEKLLKRFQRLKIGWKLVSYHPKANYPVAGLHDY